MGEAFFSMTCEFPTEQAAAAALEPMREFLKKVSTAYWDWQDTRGKTGTHEERFNALTERNREVFDAFGFTSPEFVAKIPEWGLNALCGEMSLPDYDGNRGPGELYICQSKPEPKMIVFGGEVWHMADWTRACRAIEAKFGCKCCWSSDKHTDLTPEAAVSLLATFGTEIRRGK